MENLGLIIAFVIAVTVIIGLIDVLSGVKIGE